MITILDSTTLDFFGVIISIIKPIAITMMTVTKSIRMNHQECKKYLVLESIVLFQVWHQFEHALSLQ